MKDRYFLKYTPESEWEEVDKPTWIFEERNAGFMPKSGDPSSCATGGFSGGSGVAGKIKFAENYNAY